MDFAFHLQQGQLLLEKKDEISIKKALEHFKAANQMTDEKHIGKPKILFFLALGNLWLENIVQSYKIAHKAKRSIENVVENSLLSMNNIRQMIGEDDIDALIYYIDTEYAQLVLFADTDKDFDDNELDFSTVNNINHTNKRQQVEPEFSINSLTEDTLFFTFMGLGRDKDEFIYFDKLKGDVLSHLQGYFLSHTEDQSVAGQRLANRIINGEPMDFVDEDRYILIHQLLLTEFLNEYKKQTKGKEPFLSFPEHFSIEILKKSSKTIEELTFNNYIKNEFHEIFNKKYRDRSKELKYEYSNIFDNTCIELAKSWITNKILGDAIEPESNF